MVGIDDSNPEIFVQLLYTAIYLNCQIHAFAFLSNNFIQLFVRFWN